MRFILSLMLLLPYPIFAVELAPEDGSIVYNSFVFYPARNNEINPAIEKAFLAEGVTPKRSKIYEWLQDILFVSSTGEAILMPDFNPSSSYFGDFTMGVFEDEGGEGRLVKIQKSKIDFQFDKGLVFQEVQTLYLEGGATISGKFANGDNYLIITQIRFINSWKAYNSNLQKKITKEEFEEAVLSEFEIKSGNLILLDSIAGTEHLDLYMKALPNGVILLDDPFTKRDYLQSLDAEEKLNNILQYELSDNYFNKREAYKKKIKYVKKKLSEKLDVISIPGRFFSEEKYPSGLVLPSEEVNFFNGINGINKSNGERFYITNRAKDLSILEKAWIKFLGGFSYHPDHIHFVGEYSFGAGLDCMGVMVP